MICPLCNEDGELYIVDYPAHQGYICHECNKEIVEEQTSAILKERDPSEMSALLRQRANYTGVSWPIRQKNRGFNKK